MRPNSKYSQTHFYYSNKHLLIITKRPNKVRSEYIDIDMYGYKRTSMLSRTS